MENKKLIVSLMTIVSLLLVATLISATSDELATNVFVSVDKINPDNRAVAVIAGESVEIKVVFESLVNASDIRIEAEIEGDKVDSQTITAPFDVESGFNYKKDLVLKVPSDLEDRLSDDTTLTITIKNKDFETEQEFELRVQRESYSVDVKSIDTDQNVMAGDVIPVDVVLENVGYNDLDDVFVTVRIPALNVERTGYFNDIVAIECNEDDDDSEDIIDTYGVDIDRNCNEDDSDTVYGRVFLTIPYGAKTGVYNMEIVVDNEDLHSVQTKQIAVQNEFSSGNVIVSSTSKTVAVGQEASYDILIVNPTNTLKVYRIVTESSTGISSTSKETVVAVPAGSSETVTISAKPSKEGDQTFNVNIFSGEELVKTVTLTANVKGKSVSATNPVVILTVILAIIFIVLLVVLIVLISKRPEKSEEFGESYY